MLEQDFFQSDKRSTNIALQSKQDIESNISNEITLEETTNTI